MVLVIGDKQNYKQMNIVATVAMPLYNMGKIAELALEGLCNQVTDYKWELIVCEEQNDQMLGWEKIQEYEDSLIEAGCESFGYIPLKEWIPLGQKWKIMAELASDTECFILQAGDCYPHDRRIEETVDAFLAMQCNYYDEQKGYFYSFKHKKTIFFDPAPNYFHPCRLNMAWKTSLIKKLPDNKVRKSVDGYLYNTLKAIVPIIPYRNKSFHIGVDTHGYNNISKRAQFFTKPNNIFKPTEVDITEELPILKKFTL